MGKLLRRLGYVAGVLLVATVIGSGIVYFVSESRINKIYTINEEMLQIAIPTDAASIEEGERMATIRGCTGCHQPNLGGGEFINFPPLIVVGAANLTTGKGGVGGTYTTADWVRSVRHGVGTDGKPLAVMPVYEFNQLSDEELGRIIAYIKTRPAVDNVYQPEVIGPLGRFLMVTNQIPAFGAELVDHTRRAPASVAPSVSAEYGQYLAITCTGCHGQTYAGGPLPAADADDPPAANLTPAGNLSKWTEDDFVNFFRSGRTPDGRNLNPEYMPWPMLGTMTDDELRAVYLYLKTLPAKTTGSK